MTNAGQTNRPTLLVVDDDADTRNGVARALAISYGVLTAPDAEVALKTLEENPAVALVLTDVRMPGADGFALLKSIRAKHPKLPVVLLTAYGTMDQAVAAIKDGADDFVTKPIDLDALELRVAQVLKTSALQQEVTALRQQLDDKFGLEQIIGTSDAMKRVLHVVRQAAPSDATILIQGPNGTGKELIAHAIHVRSPRARGPFVAVNCGAIPETLIESELFGHEKGAFTGAVARKAGRFEAADGGSLFLDEIGELPLALQVKLLRALENRTIQPLGAAEEKPVDIRVIAATNRDLAQLVAEGRFREDLYYRLNVIDVHLPALKDRAGDVGLLAAHFVEESAARNGGRVTGIDPAAVRLLEAYSWPGNVRELRNAIEKMVVLSAGGRLGVEDVPDAIRAAAGAPAAPVAVASSAGATLGEMEKQRIFTALREAHGNRTQAARALGISRRTIYRKLDEYAAAGETIP